MSPTPPADRSFAARLWRRLGGARGDAHAVAPESAPGPAAAATALDVATIGDLDPRSLAPDHPVAFRCNLCGEHAHARLDQLSRESPSCPRCASTVRFRAIARLVVRGLTGEDRPLIELAPRHDLSGVGLSDAACYAEPLAEAFAYRNTYFHKAPRLDITSIHPGLRGTADFVVASDVFEHVEAPVQRAFDNVLALLRPGGLFVFTVPFSLDSDTLEHFPELHEWSIGKTDGSWLLVNKTTDGRLQTFRDLVFHGGPGATLEMRLFSRDAIFAHLTRAGFVDARVADEPYLPFGIHWPEPWSVPITARAPRP